MFLNLRYGLLKNIRNFIIDTVVGKDMCRIFKVWRAIKEEFEIIVLLFVFSLWYLYNINGFLSYDMAQIPIASYAIVTGRNIYLDANHPPLAQYIIGSGQMLFGETLFGAKISAIVFSILTIYFTYKIGRKIGNRYTGFFAALLLGMTKLYSEHAVQVTYDIILTFFLVLLFYVIMIYMEKRDFYKRKSISFIQGILFACVITSKTQGIIYGIPILAIILFKDMDFRAINNAYTGIKNRISSPRARYSFFGFLLAFIIIYSPYLRFDYTGISNELAWRHVPDSPVVKYIPHLPAIFYMLGFTYWAASLSAVHRSYQLWEPFNLIFQYGGLTFIAGLLIAVIYVQRMKASSKKLPQGFSFLITYTAISFLLVSIILPATPRHFLPLFPFFSILVISSIFCYIKQISGNKAAIIGIIVLLLLPTSPVIATIKEPGLAGESVYSDAAHYLINYSQSHPQKKMAAAVPLVIKYYLADKPANLNIEDLPYPLAYTGFSEEYSEKLYQRITNGELDILIERKPLPGESGYPVNQRIHEYAAAHAKSKVVLEAPAEGEVYIYHLT